MLNTFEAYKNDQITHAPRIKRVRSVRISIIFKCQRLKSLQISTLITFCTRRSNSLRTSTHGGDNNDDICMKLLETNSHSTFYHQLAASKREDNEMFEYTVDTVSPKLRTAN